MPNKYNIKIKKSEVMYSGFNKITKYFFEFSSFDKKTNLNVEKEIFERKDAVAVLLYDPKLDSVVIIEQFRPGCFVAENIAFPLEIPAGLIDESDANFEEVAKQEALEEANCDIQKIMKIGYFFPEISFSSRRIYLFCGKVDASNLHPRGGVKSENEDTKISIIHVNELKKMMEDGAFINSHTIVAVQWFFLNLEKVQEEFS